MPIAILMISGSLRTGSTNTALLRTGEAIPLPDGVTTTLYDGVASLPHYNPDDDSEPLHRAVADLRRRLEAADAVLFSTPEYAGALPGSFKNLLDWTVGGGTYGKPVAWINASASSSGAIDAHDSLRKVLVRTGTDIVEAACVRIPVPRDAVGSEGVVTDPVLCAEVTRVLAVLADHVEGSRR